MKAILWIKTKLALLLSMAVVLGIVIALVGLGLLLLPRSISLGESSAAPAAAPVLASNNNIAAVSSPAGASKTTAPTLLTLNINPQKSTVGSEIRVSAQGLPPNKNIELIWKTVQGNWVIEDYYHFKGKKFSEENRSLGRFVVDSNGRLDARFIIPEDYGGVHDIVALAGGTTLAQGGVEVVQTFEMSPKEGPVGTLVEIRGTGLGWRTMESTWVVNWDNSEIGWVSAVSTPGSAVARFRATGAEGDHLVKVYSGYMGQSYLNYEQAPNAYLPRPDFIFHLTSGSTVPAQFAESYQPQQFPQSDNPAGTHFTVNPSQGPVLTPVTLQGEGLPPNTSVSLVWQTWVGSRVSGNGFEPKEKVLQQLMVTSQGRIEAPVTIPDDLGGLHTLVLKHEDQVLARTYFAIETSIVSITPVSGPVGTKVTIHLKGVGWTEYDNIYVATYDNAYMGYVCGFNSNGDVVFSFTAGGESGVHLIDLYPGIYQGPAEGQQLYRLPQLTYAEDHPGNKIPALHFAFKVTQ